MGIIVFINSWFVIMASRKEKFKAHGEGMGHLSIGKATKGRLTQEYLRFAFRSLCFNQSRVRVEGLGIYIGITEKKMETTKIYRDI